MLNSQDKDFEVIHLPSISHSISRTTSESNQDSIQILRFKDQEAFDRTLESVKAMNDTEKKEFFNEIGFEGAYLILNNAEEALDEAFDLAETVDSITGVDIINDCVAKYNGVLVFNELDSCDVTPSLPFFGEQAEFLGNKEGFIMIGDELVAPSTQSVSPAYNGSFIRYSAEVKVKNGKYTSFFRLGRIGVNMAFQLETYRKILCFKKHDKKCCYDGELYIYSNGKSEKAQIHNGKGNWKLYSPASNYSPRVNMNLKNFSSTRNSNNKVTKSVSNILVK
ncbi:MAG: DUF4848 domain-containing protein [Muribaculaceae bacterium]